MAEHFIEYCKVCNAVVSQCRCAGPKQVRFGYCLKHRPGADELLAVIEGSKTRHIGVSVGTSGSLPTEVKAHIASLTKDYMQAVYLALGHGQVVVKTEVVKREEGT